MQDIVVIGIGSDFNGDDEVGLVVARQLKTRAPSGVRVIENNGDAFSLISAWRGMDYVILVDAAASGAKPGKIHRFDPYSDPFRAKLTPTSSHTFGIEEALELSRRLDQLPKRIVIYGIEGKNFSFGAELSMEVGVAVDSVVGQILDEISIV